MKRPYIPMGCDQQSRTTPTLLQRIGARIITDDPTDGPPDAPTRPAPLGNGDAADWGSPTLMYACVIVLALVLLALGGCGGGADLLEADEATQAEQQAGTQPVDCKATPRACA